MAKRLSVGFFLMSIFIANHDSMGQQIKNEKYKDYTIDSGLITTRDGASISINVIKRKEMKEPQPVILMFTIYAYPINPDRVIERLFADKGFVGVLANTRGKRNSPQHIMPFEDDANDAYDIIDWISKQSWCNGKIGMIGASYEGFAQWAAVKTVHPALKTIIPAVAVGIGIDYPMMNGVFMSYALRWIHHVSNSKLIDQGDFMNIGRWDSVYSVWYKSGRSFRALDTIDGRPNAIFQRWLKHPSFDSFWYNMVTFRNDFSHVNIPVLTITGYFDADQLGALYYYNEHITYYKEPNHYLLMGPYTHQGAGGEREIQDSVGGYAIDPVAKLSIRELCLQWLNYILKDSSKPTILKDKINFQVMGTNSWRHVPGMSQVSNDTLTFYLSNLREGNDYKLSANRVINGNGFIQQNVDFMDRDEGENQIDRRISKTLNKQNYISFMSEPMNQPLSISGRFLSDLNLIINKKDLDIEMKLYELTTDGHYFRLCSYLGRASYTKDPAKRQLLEPGKKELIPLRQTYFISRQLNKGSRLIVLLGVKKSKDYQINYGTGKDVSDETIADGKIPLEIKWLSDSWIKVPVFKDK